MACILHIETSTKICSVALSLDGVVLLERVETRASSHARLVGVYAQEIVTYAKNQGLKIDAIAVSEGPGSYTGLRIGVSEAKGLCYGFDIPLIAIPTLKVIAEGFLCSDSYKEVGEGGIGLICPMMDARRMEVYSAVYDLSLNEIQPVQAKIIDESSFSDLLIDHKIAFFGDGSDKCRETITSKNALFVEGIVPLARNMVRFAEYNYRNNDFVDTAYFEPFYLKEFQATTPKKLL